MNHKRSVDQEMHLKALEVAGRYLKCTGELLDVLQALDEQKTFRSYDCTSLYQYAVKHLKLSEGCAFNLITVARKSAELPAMKQEIKAGTLSLTKARKLCSVIDADNQAQWLDFAKTFSSKALEREIARVNPKAAVEDKATYISWNRLKLELGISEECLQKLRRVQDLESQRLQKPVDFEGTLSAALDVYLEKCDPVKKAQRITAKKVKINAPQLVSRRVKVERNTSPRKPRKPCPAELKQQIDLRDQGRCTRINSQNERCGSTRWLDVHHIIAVKDSGANTLENLTTLCRVHRQMEHHHLGMQGQ